MACKELGRRPHKDEFGRRGGKIMRMYGKEDKDR